MQSFPFTGLGDAAVACHPASLLSANQADASLAAARSKRAESRHTPRLQIGSCTLFANPIS